MIWYEHGSLLGLNLRLWVGLGKGFPHERCWRYFKKNDLEFYFGCFVVFPPFWVTNKQFGHVWSLLFFFPWKPMLYGTMALMLACRLEVALLCMFPQPQSPCGNSWIQISSTKKSRTHGVCQFHRILCDTQKRPYRIRHQEICWSHGRLLPGKGQGGVRDIFFADMSFSHSTGK